MQIEKLVRDAAEVGDANSVSHACRALANRLNALPGGATITAKGINKWIERDSIPGPWVLRIARACPVDITAYG